MFRARPRTLGLIAAAALAAVPATADAATVETDVTARGGLTLTWRGDPALGCAERGQCDVRGAATLGSSDGGSVGSSSSSSSPFGETISLSSGPAIVRVLRGPLTDPAGACVDRFDETNLELVPGRRTRRGVRLALRTAAPFTEGASSLPAGRCAGPLPADLEDALPAVVVPRRLLRSGRSVLDLRGRSTFTAGPFRGEVLSTLRVRVSRRTREDDDDVGSAEPVFEPRPRPGARRRARPPRPRALELEYRIAGMDGELVTGFTGGPACLDPGGCGLSGTHRLTLGSLAAPSALKVEVSGTSRSIRRPTVAAALDALAAGRVDVYAFEDVEVPRSARAVAVVSAPGGPDCRDEQDPLLPGLDIEGAPGGLRVALEDSSFSEVDSDLLRTRCEGPGSSDVAGEGALASAEIPASALAQPSLELRLRPGAPPAGGAFAVTRSGELVVRLERTRARIVELTP